MTNRVLVIHHLALSHLILLRISTTAGESGNNITYVDDNLFITMGWIANSGGVGGRGEGWAVGADGEPKAGHTIHKETDSSSASPAGHRNSHSRHGRPRRSLAAA